MTASRTGNIEAMTVLLDHGAEVNAKETLRGTTPLMWAADEAHAPAVQLLIKRGADINAKSNPAPRGRGPALGKSERPAQGGCRSGRRPGRRPVGRVVAASRRAGHTAGGVPAAAAVAPADAPAPLRPMTARTMRGRLPRPPGGERRRRADGADLRRRAPTISPPVKVLLEAGADVNQTTGYGWRPLLVADAEPLLQAGGTCSSTAPTRTWRTRAAGRRSISRPTTATSSPATIRSARAPPG